MIPIIFKNCSFKIHFVIFNSEEDGGGEENQGYIYIYIYIYMCVKLYNVYPPFLILTVIVLLLLLLFISNYRKSCNDAYYI